MQSSTRTEKERVIHNVMQCKEVCVALERIEELLLVQARQI